MTSRSQPGDEPDNAVTRAPRVYISIVNWNNYQHTIACLQSLESLDYPHYDVVVVDNASLNESVSRLRAAFPQLTIIRAEENLGYAGGHRLALGWIQQTGAELMWILNNDVIVQPATLRTLVEAFQQFGSGLYGSVPLDAASESRIHFTGWSVDSGGQPLFLQQETVSWDVRYADWLTDMQPRRVANISGSSFLIPLAVIDRFGFMDASFFLYGEETDYCFRMARHGIPSYVVPGSIVVHRLRGASDTNALLQGAIHYYKVRNRLRLVGSYLGHRDYFVQLRQYLRRHQCLKLLIKALVLRRNVRESEPKNYFACRGIWDALWNRRGKTIAPEAFWTQVD